MYETQSAETERFLVQIRGWGYYFFLFWLQISQNELAHLGPKNAFAFFWVTKAWVLNPGVGILLFTDDIAQYSSVVPSSSV